MSTQIEPTVGRKILFYTNGAATPHVCGCGPNSADIAHVNKDGTVNLMVIGCFGEPFSAREVRLVQAGETPPESGTPYCRWMPYQIGQAAKTEELATKLVAGEGTNVAASPPPQSPPPPNVAATDP
jgi:hypothetical protein